MSEGLKKLRLEPAEHTHGPRVFMKANLTNFAVVLHEPRYPENIGAAARCCRNMGIPQLITVRPRLLDRGNMLKMATHEASELIESMLVYDTLEEALTSFQHVVGTTARTGRQRRPTDTPRTLARRLLGLSQENRIALLFGSENWGLTNGHLRRCQSLVTIPTTEFSSINLAQSVMILCYELLLAESHSDVVLPQLATIHEIEGMYAHLREMFQSVEFVHPQSPEYWMTNVRQLLGRRELRSKEVRVVRGFCRQILWVLAKARVSFPNPVPRDNDRRLSDGEARDV